MALTYPKPAPAESPPTASIAADAKSAVGGFWTREQETRTGTHVSGEERGFPFRLQLRAVEPVDLQRVDIDVRHTAQVHRNHPLAVRPDAAAVRRDPASVAEMVADDLLVEEISRDALLRRLEP